MSELNRKDAKYHRRKILNLSSNDHALVFRKNKDGGIDVHLHLGKKKGVVTDGGVLLATLGINVFDPEMNQKLTNQMSVINETGKLD